MAAAAAELYTFTDFVHDLFFIQSMNDAVKESEQRKIAKKLISRFGHGSALDATRKLLYSDWNKDDVVKSASLFGISKNDAEHVISYMSEAGVGTGAGADEEANNGFNYNETYENMGMGNMGNNNRHLYYTEENYRRNDFNSVKTNYLRERNKLIHTMSERIANPKIHNMYSKFHAYNDAIRKQHEFGGFKHLKNKVAKNTQNAFMNSLRHVADKNVKNAFNSYAASYSRLYDMAHEYNFENDFNYIIGRQTPVPLGPIEGPVGGAGAGAGSKKTRRFRRRNNRTKRYRN